MKLQYYIVVNVVIHISKSKGVAEMTNKTNKIKKKGGSGLASSAKTLTSNGKQFTVSREMMTAVARDRWNLSAVFKFCVCFILLYNKSQITNHKSISMFPSTSSPGNIDILGKQNSLFPSGPVIKC